MLEDKNNKQVHTCTGGQFKKKEMLRDNNSKQVHTRIGEPLKTKEMLKRKTEQTVHNFSDVVSTGKLSTKRER